METRVSFLSFSKCKTVLSKLTIPSVNAYTTGLFLFLCSWEAAAANINKSSVVNWVVWWIEKGAKLPVNWIPKANILQNMLACMFEIILWPEKNKRLLLKSFSCCISRCIWSKRGREKCIWRRNQILPHNSAERKRILREHNWCVHKILKVKEQLIWTLEKVNWSRECGCE